MELQHIYKLQKLEIIHTSHYFENPLEMSKLLIAGRSYCTVILGAPCTHNYSNTVPTAL
jgi:hypothetical protein